MKRSASLRSLSRDHHQSLVAAQQLRHATTQTATERRAAFLVFWEAEGRAHFRVEEEVLLPAYAGYGDPFHPLVAQVLGDHVAIRHGVAVLAANPDVPLSALHDLGQRLADHVRLEERELFPLVEGALPAERLAALGHALQRAEREGRPDG